MPTNQYLPFGTGGGANTLPYASYAAMTTLISGGFLNGLARSEQVNTVLRQATVAAAGVAKFATDYGPLDCLDDGSSTNFALAVKAAVDALVGGSQFWAPGDLKYSAVGTQTGWLRANGAVVSRTTYAALFAAIGTTFGAGNGTTTFGLPDYRGEFLRGLDDGRGVDPGRVLATAQAQQVLKHKHMTQWGEATGGTTFGRTNTAGKFAAFGNDSDNYWFHTNDGSDYDGTVNTSGLMGTENRPRNMAAFILIKT